MGELDKENLHLNASVYQMNQNRSSGSHTVVKGVNRRNKNLLVVSTFFRRSLHNLVQNIFPKICRLTVFKNQFIKSLPFFDLGGSYITVWN